MMRWSYVDVIVITFSAPATFAMPGGKPIAPVATIVPWPLMSRGTEAIVPIPPGFVSERLAPCRSSAVSELSRARVIRSLKASRNSGNDSRPASRITGTISVRPPSLRSTSTAMPRLTAPASTTCGLPSISVNERAITGICSVAARAMANAIRCVKETRWPASLSCLRRLSSVVTVSVRNEVAVGIARDSSM